LLMSFLADFSFLHRTVLSFSTHDESVHTTLKLVSPRCDPYAYQKDTVEMSKMQ
jgi:hypothetical protein